MKKLKGFAVITCNSVINVYLCYGHKFATCYCYVLQTAAKYSTNSFLVSSIKRSRPEVTDPIRGVTLARLLAAHVLRHR